jgi:hypothetical protein
MSVATGTRIAPHVGVVVQVRVWFSSLFVISPSSLFIFCISGVGRSASSSRTRFPFPSHDL